MRVRTLTLAAAAISFLVVPAPGGAETDADADVDVHNFFFSPSSVTIDAHDRVTWHWVTGFHSVETLDGSEEWCPAQGSGTCTRVFDLAGTYDYRCGLHPTTMTGVVTVVGIPPLVAITSPGDGDPVDGLITVTGTASHPEGITAVEMQVDDGPFEPVDELGSPAWSTGLDTTLYDNGVHTLTARATGGDGATATASIDVVIDNPAVIDLVVVSYEAGPGGNTGLLRAEVANDGNVAVAGIALLFEEHYQGAWHEIATLTVDIVAFGTATVEHEWTPLPSLGDFDTRVRLDPDDVITEPDETNNSGADVATFYLSGIEGIHVLDPV